MSEFETQSDTAQEAQALTTFIKKEHHQIGEGFVNRVMAFLTRGKYSIKTYAVQCEKYYEIEAISFDIDEKTSLEVKITRMK